jgi:hypothetical protein
MPVPTVFASRRGGLNYAEGGARVALAYSQTLRDPEGTPICVEVQLQHFIAQHGRILPSMRRNIYSSMASTRMHTW